MINKSLPPPSIDEITLIDEYKKKFNELNFTKQNTIAAWQQNVVRLLELTQKDNLRCFLRWDVIQKTMFISYSHFIVIEFIYLMRSHHWVKQWKNAITESHAGYPTPFFLYRKSSSNLIHHAYHLAQFQEFSNIDYSNINFVFEFGGGYGSMCRLVHNLGFQGEYIIYDLASFSLLQEFYLRLLLLMSKNKINYYNNNVFCISSIETITEKNINLGELSRGDNLFIATWSLSESPMNIRQEMEKIITNYKYILIAYQGEFDEYNNSDYFMKLKQELSQYKWVNKKIKHLPNNYYLFGQL